MAKVDLSKVPVYYHKYIQLVPTPELKEAFIQHQTDLTGLLESLQPEKWQHRYGADKWSVKEVVQHIIDAERIFCYRALTFARKDENALPGFDENNYASNSKADKRNPSDLLNELIIIQKSSAALFDSFDDEQLNAEGVASGNRIYVGGIGFIINGHTLHHKKILLERYLK